MYALWNLEFCQLSRSFQKEEKKNAAKHFNVFNSIPVGKILKFLKPTFQRGNLDAGPGKDEIIVSPYESSRSEESTPLFKSTVTIQRPETELLKDNYQQPRLFANSSEFASRLSGFNSILNSTDVPTPALEQRKRVEDKYIGIDINESPAVTVAKPYNKSSGDAVYANDVGEFAPIAGPETILINDNQKEVNSLKCASEEVLKASASQNSSPEGLAVVFITTDNNTIQRIKKQTSAFSYTSGNDDDINCKIITVISNATYSKSSNEHYKYFNSNPENNEESNNSLCLAQSNVPDDYGNSRNEDHEQNSKVATDVCNLNYVHNFPDLLTKGSSYLNIVDSDQNNNKRNGISVLKVGGEEFHKGNVSPNPSEVHATDLERSTSSNISNNVTNISDDISFHFKTEHSEESTLENCRTSNPGECLTDLSTNITETTTVSVDCRANVELQNISIHNLNNEDAKKEQFKNVTSDITVRTGANKFDFNNICRQISLNSHVNKVVKEFNEKQLLNQEKNNLITINQHKSAKNVSVNINEKLSREQNDTQVNHHDISEPIATENQKENYKHNDLQHFQQVKDDILDFGEHLSSANCPDISNDINECYNVKLDAPEEVIVAGFHDFCHTMLSLEDVSLESYDTGTIKRKPTIKEKIDSKNYKCATNSSNEGNISDDSNITDDKTHSLNNKTFRNSLREIKSSAQILETTDVVLKKSDDLLKEIQNSKLMKKGLDICDAEVMEAIRVFDKSIMEEAPYPPSLFSENKIATCSTDGAEIRMHPNVVVEVKTRAVKEDKIQCDNLIEELTLENISKPILNSDAPFIRNTNNGVGTIAVTISNTTTPNHTSTMSSPDFTDNLESLRQNSNECFIENPDEETLQLKSTGHRQGELICTFNTQCGPLSSCHSPPNSLNLMSITDTRVEEIKRINSSLEAKEDSLSLPNSFTSEEQNVDPLPSSPLQVSLDTSPMSHNSSQDIAACHRTSPCSVDSGTSSHNQGYFVVVAIDFGTTYSGYAFSFTRDPDNVHMMKKWDGGDPGVFNQKTPTTLLLTPEGSFHSFGYSARDFYHDLDTEEAKRWLYFDKFKMALHYSEHLSLQTELAAANGTSLPAVDIFAYALGYFKDHALQELSDQSATRILNEDVRWVVTVPAIWKQTAKQFMRTASYKAGIASPEFADQLLIALEPEAASIYCRRMRLHQLVPNETLSQKSSFRWQNDKEYSLDHMTADRDNTNMHNIQNQVDSSFGVGTRYMVVDCGGGTVDITVHEILDKHGTLKELQKASGGPYGSIGVDMEFEKLLCDIFGKDFIQQFKAKCPTGYVDLMVAFEARKRNASPYKSNPLNISLPFAFIDFFKKFKGSSVETTLKKSSHKDVKWSSQGMLRLEQSAMEKLFSKTVRHIREHIEGVVSTPDLNIDYLFLVGGFAESLILQKEVKDQFSPQLKVIIPQGVSLAILKGAVLFGLDPTIVNIRRLRMTYGVGVLNRFIHGVHPKEKLVVKDNIQWCADVFDKFVVTDQSVGVGDVVVRSYTPAKAGQSCSVIHIYCSEKDNVYFITDQGVKRCATLILDLSDSRYVQSREIQTRMMFGDTEIKVSALDVITGKCVKSEINFLSH